MTAMRIVKKKIKYLKTYDHRDATYRPSADREIDELAADMKKNGHVHPIEVTGDGRIIDDHARAEAARRLEWTELDAWVRDDRDALGIAQRHVEANLNRRQLDPLDQARAIR